MDDDAPEAMPGSCAGASSKPFQRFESLTGAGRRRSLTTGEKLALVTRMARCENISELARDLVRDIAGLCAAAEGADHNAGSKAWRIADGLFPRCLCPSNHGILVLGSKARNANPATARASLPAALLASPPR
jgi:hypothetical protein